MVVGLLKEALDVIVDLFRCQAEFNKGTLVLFQPDIEVGMFMDGLASALDQDMGCAAKQVLGIDRSPHVLKQLGQAVGVSGGYGMVGTL